MYIPVENKVLRFHFFSIKPLQTQNIGQYKFLQLTHFFNRNTALIDDDGRAMTARLGCVLVLARHVLFKGAQPLQDFSAVEALEVLVFEPMSRLEMPLVVEGVVVGVVADKAVRGDSLFVISALK